MMMFSPEFGLQLFKGSSGGGSSSGVVDFPDYMKTWHGLALDGGGVDTPTSSITDIINAAVGSSPFTGETAYDPDTDITAYETAIAGFDTLIAAIDEPTDWAALYTQAETSIDAAVDDDVDAFADQLDDEITTKVLPRFEAGMRDINAVVSSAFVIGRSNIEGFRNREVAAHASKIRLTAQTLYLEATSQMMRFLIAKYGWEESYMRTVVEGKRIKISAKKEETETNLRIGESDSLWDLGVFRYGGNLLSSISGATISEKSETKSEVWPSVIGGALSGAAAGAMIGGGPWGAVAGGVLGAASGFI